MSGLGVYSLFVLDKKLLTLLLKQQPALSVICRVGLCGLRLTAIEIPSELFLSVFGQAKF